MREKSSGTEIGPLGFQKWPIDAAEVFMGNANFDVFHPHSYKTWLRRQLRLISTEVSTNLSFDRIANVLGCREEF